MIVFDNWVITADGSVIARQHDNLSRSITVTGVPPGWTWDMLVSVGEDFDILPLTETDGTASVTLTDDMLPVSGIYTLVLRGTKGDTRQHTNKLFVTVPASLSGDAHWPVLPHEFSEFEKRMRELLSASTPAVGENGNLWFGGADTGVNLVRMQTLSYVGTGTFGQSNPNVLTFDFEPKLVIVVDSAAPYRAMICVRNSPMASSSIYNRTYAYLNWNGKELSWYSPSSIVFQLNDSNATYYVVAIG